MSVVWTEVMRQALDRAGDVPARVEIEGEVHVLLPQDEYTRTRECVPGLPEVPAVSEPVTRRLFALVPLAVYDRIQPLFEEDPISPQERRSALRLAGLRAGWNDPIWDDLDSDSSQP
jgi:hypothetical protein